MDRKAWVILILCSIGLVLNFKYNMSNEEALREQPKQEESEKSESRGAKGADASEGSLVTEKVEVSERREDVPVKLVGKDGDKVDVIYHFTSFGGGVKKAEFPKQKAVIGDGNVNLNSHSEYAVGALTNDYRSIDDNFYEVIEGGKDGDSFVIYRGKLSTGVEVTKKWSLKNDSGEKGYQLHLDVSFNNESGKSFDLLNWGVFTGTAAPLYTDEFQDKAGWFYYEDGDFEHEASSPFTKGFWPWSDGAKPVEILTVKNLEYAGVNSQFFTTFFMPKDFKSESIWATGHEVDLGDEDGEERWVYQMGVGFPEKKLSSGESQSYAFDIYMGPRERDIIKLVGPHTDDVMNYGWFWFVANFMNKAVVVIHGWFEGFSWAWGIAVILLTVFIRILIWPLHNKSTRTMKRMGKLQPMMKELKEKYADNPQKVNQETMKLYREYGVNPMGGCLPMLIQIPIFFGVFKMLGSAVEMRGASFMWVDDLSMPDTVAEVWGIPINLLPIIMAVTMVFQMRLTPQSGDKLQRRIFMLMPLMFFFFCYNYAAALALYWSTQNVVSIAQTLLMKKLPDVELKKKPGGKAKPGEVEVVDDGKPRKKGFFEKLAEKMEEVQAQQEAAKGIDRSKPKNPAMEPPKKKAKKRGPRTGG